MGACSIINATINAIEDYYDLLGTGTPVSGDIFSFSSSQFGSVIETQSSTALGDNWLGSAAEKYSSKSQTLQDYEQTMADVDYITGTLIEDQAEAVKKARNTLEDWIDFLEDCKPYARALYNPFTITACYVFQAVVSATATVAVIVALVELLLTTIQNAEKLVNKLEAIAQLLAELPSDIVSDLAGLVGDAVSDVQSEVSAIVSDLKSEISDLTSDLSSLMSGTGLSDLSSLMSESGLSSGSGLSDLSSLMSGSGLSDLSSLMSGSGSSSGSGLADLASGSGLADLSSGSGLFDPSSGSGLPALPGLPFSSGASVPAGLSAAAFSGLPTTGQTTGLPGALSARAAQDSQVPQGVIPPGLLSRGKKDQDDEKGAASGAVDAERAPVDATDPPSLVRRWAGSVQSQ